MSEPEPAPIPAPAPPPRPKAASHAWYGKTIARCKVGERIGRGATSHVFKATYVPLNKEIAVKILSGDRALDQEARARFLGEAKAIARLDHENIVKVLDVVEDQGCLCILMEYVGGQTLQDLLDDEKVLAPKRALRTALQVARALEAAHEEEIVHRDIKPANVMLIRGGDLVKVVDFGLAVRGVENRVGTPMFMSPEAAQGKRIDDKSDVYALGVCLYQMLTGRLPFGGATVKEILAAHVSTEAAPPSRVKRELGDRYDALLAKMLVKAKGYRPAAAEVVDLLEEMLDEPQEQRGKGRRTRRRRGGKKSAAPLAISLGGVAILAVVGIVALVRSSDAPEDSGAVAGGGTKTVEPPPDPAALARRAYDEADSWDREHRTDAAGRVQRWTEAERACAGTDWAAKAAERRKEAEADAAKQKADREREAADRKAREELEARIKAQHEEIVTLVKACDFEGASTRADRLGAPPGTDTKAWNGKVARLRYLKEHFVPKFDERVKAGRLRAAVVKPAAGPEEMVTGAARAGLETDKGAKIAWGSVKPEDLLKGATKVFAQSRPEDSLFLAAFSKELGLDAQAKNFAEATDMTDGQGLYKEKLREFFPK
jgi:tRNA A-37 threonylcarbamoyl transferase component Bud32